MPNERYRTLVWESLLDADYRARYFGHLAGRLQRTERLITVAVTLLSSGAVATILFKTGNDYLTAALSLLAALFSGVMAVYKLGKAAGTAAALLSKWSSVKNKLEVFWSGIDELPAKEVEKRWLAIESEIGKETEIAALEFTLSGRLAKKAQAEVMRSRRLVEAA
jgi:hypothetical protein